MRWLAVIDGAALKHGLIKNHMHWTRGTHCLPFTILLNFTVTRFIFFVGKAFAVRAYYHCATDWFVRKMQRHHRKRGWIFRDLERHRWAGKVIHVPQIRTDFHGHADPITFVKRTARGVAVRQATQIVANHVLIVFKTTASQYHRLIGFDIDGFAILQGDHTNNVLRQRVL